MNRYDILEYLANLHTILDAQEKAGRKKSTWLGREYNRVWHEFENFLKAEQQKEDEDEARRREREQSEGGENGTSPKSS